MINLPPEMYLEIGLYLAIAVGAVVSNKVNMKSLTDKLDIHMGYIQRDIEALKKEVARNGK